MFRHRLSPILLTLCLAAPALALQESAGLREGSVFELALPGLETAPVFPRVSTDPGLSALSAALGGRWSMQRNQGTGTAHLVWGSGASLPEAAGADAATLERLAREIVADQPQLFGLPAEELALLDIRRQGGKSVVWFQQMSGGVPVAGARAHVLFHDSGRLMGLGSDLHPTLALSNDWALDRATAVSLARAGLPFVTARDEVVMAERVIVPLTAAGTTDYLAGWRVVIHSEEPPGRWNTLLDAATGRVLERRNEICLVNVQGQVVGDVHWTGWCDGDTPDVPFPNQYLDIQGGGSGFSDTEGNFDLVHGGTDPVVVVGSLRGHWLNVDIFENGAPEGSISTILTPGVPGQIYWSDASARNDEVDTYVHANRIHDYVKFLDTAFTGLDYEMPCIVDRTDGYCPGNAWWDYTGINFCRDGQGYSNTGELGNVIYHEFGHGITTYVYGGPSSPQPSSDLHEGNSDIAGLLMDDESIVGIGFFQGNCVSGIRNADNDLVYPTDMGGSGHFNGQILSGVFWDAYADLRASFGVETARDIVAQAWHDGRMLGIPDNFPDQVYWTFVADDDDGDLDNGTPHHASFCAGAEHHGFDCPEVIFGVVFTHTPLGDTTDDVNPYALQATIVSTESAIDVDSAILRYRVNLGPWIELPLTYDGGDGFSGAIPAMPVGSQVDYYLYAEDIGGLSATEPDGAPASYHRFFVSWLIDPIEVADGWVEDPYGTDGCIYNGVWMHVDPVGSSAQPEDDHTPDGTHCWVTGQHIEGNNADADDVDFGATTLLSPLYDLSGATSASIRYWRWYSNNGPDVFEVWLSNDDGGSWTLVESDAASTNGWVDVVQNLGDHFAAPALLRIKFIAKDFGAMNTVEAAVDDISILASFEDLTAVDEGLAVEFATGLRQNSPNPFNPTTKISFNLAAAGPVRLAVYDARGRELRVLVQGHMAAGEQQVIWDGRDREGRALASGVYLYRLETAADVISKRMVLLK